MIDRRRLIVTATAAITSPRILRAAAWSGLVPSSNRSPPICQKKTPRNPCFMAQAVRRASDSASS